MKQNLKTQLERFDKGAISIKMFVAKIREISEMPFENNISKEEVIQDYLNQLKRIKEKKRLQRNSEYIKKYMSDPEKRKRRSELDKARYLRNKSIGNN
jgi:antitoxin component of RelBE/YafQ-DinJ toxin-antitoxin module